MKSKSLGAVNVMKINSFLPETNMFKDQFVRKNRLRVTCLNFLF